MYLRRIRHSRKKRVDKKERSPHPTQLLVESLSHFSLADDGIRYSIYSYVLGTGIYGMVLGIVQYMHYTHINFFLYVFSVFHAEVINTGMI